MKKPAYIACFFLLGVIAVSIWWIRGGQWPQLAGTSLNMPPASAPARESSPGANAHRSASLESASPITPTAEGIAVLADVAEVARNLHKVDSTAENDLEILQSIIDVFRRANNGLMPGGGLNEEIISELRGKNTKHFAVFPSDHPSIDAQGQLLDRWQTPYFFHPVSASQMEIRSAGPDCKLWTEDDVSSGEIKEDATPGTDG